MASDVDPSVGASSSPDRLPPDDWLYMRVHDNVIHKPTGEPMSGAFDDHEGGMSTDWSARSTPQQTRVRKTADSVSEHPASEYAVVKMRVRDVEALGLSVNYTPTPDNPAHCDVVGRKTARIQKHLKKIAEYTIRKEEPVEE